jgi:hypothetical protein
MIPHVSYRKDREMGRPRTYAEELVETAVRLPLSVHKHLKDTALERGTSLNHLLILAATAYLAALPPLEPTGNGRRQSA